MLFEYLSQDYSHKFDVTLNSFHIVETEFDFVNGDVSLQFRFVSINTVQSAAFSCLPSPTPTTPILLSDPRSSIPRTCTKHRQIFLLLWRVLTPRSRVLPEKLTCPKLLKKVPAFYRTRRFITVFTKARYLSLSRAKSIHSMPPSNV